LCIVSSKEEQYEDFLKQYLKIEYEVSRQHCYTFKRFTRKRTLSHTLYHIDPFIFFNTESSKPYMDFLKRMEKLLNFSGTKAIKENEEYLHQNYPPEHY
jgi:hypothetical protein